ncbi:hypothetical protein AUC47_06020 [Microbacterium sp. SZ1]|uniref:hypothetical protein n=1 Tax=Microbacterium sp. SZ1 TaxID=1849736 RepID=UPI000BBC83F7|nr:hypothetical protein [Microbacterium sp. SZ1]PCE14188.1 hypothetical protein AUC47_06020 [Microbacterium sp. SZ1]
MNVFEKVQETRPAIDGAEENISAARARLLSAIHSEQRPARSRAARRPWLITAGLVGAVAAVTAGVLVIGNLTTPTTGGVEAIPTVVPEPTAEPTPEPTAEPTVEPLTAAGAFSAAGASSSTFTGLTVAPGQYLRVATTTTGLVFHEPVNGWGEYSADRSNATSAWSVLGGSETYLPADQYDEWRYVGRPVQIGELFGADAGAKAQQYLQEVAHSSYDPYGEIGGAGAPWPTAGGSSLAAFYDAMPNDPAQLIAWIDENQQTPPESDNVKVGWLLIELLARNGGSAETRATMYAALSMLDGFAVTSTVGNVVTVALDTPTQDVSGNPTIQRRTATIDISTGLVQETTSTTGSGSALVPDSIPDMRSVYAMTVVNSAP